MTALKVKKFGVQYSEPCFTDLVAEFQGQLKTLLPMLQEHVILAYQEFGEKQQRGAREDWQKEKGELLDTLKESLQERVSPYCIKTHSATFRSTSMQALHGL